MKKNNTEKLLFSIFAVIGSAFLIAGIYFCISSLNTPEDVVTVTGKIVEIITDRHHDGDVDHDVYVDYEYDGKNFEGVRLGAYNSSMYEGKEIEMMIDPDKPSRPKMPGTELLLGIIFVVLGALAACVGIIPLIIMGRKGSKVKKLVEQGRYIMGKVERIEMNHSYSVNNRHPFIVYCTHQDEFSGITYRFKSDNLWSDPGAYYQIGSEIRIYVNGQDYSNYFVDVEGSMQGNAKIVDYT